MNEFIKKHVMCIKDPKSSLIYLSTTWSTQNRMIQEFHLLLIGKQFQNDKGIVAFFQQWRRNVQGLLWANTIISANIEIVDKHIALGPTRERHISVAWSVDMQIESVESWPIIRNVFDFVPRQTFQRMDIVRVQV